MRRPETQLVPSSSPVPARRPEDFPPDVHGSLATLRAIAKQAKSRTDPGLRWATDEEIALAVALQKPGMCTAHSSRTGLPCEKRRLEGANVCQTHGAGTKVARAAVTRRLQAIAMPLVSRQKELAMQSDNLTVAQKATADLRSRWRRRARRGQGPAKLEGPGDNGVRQQDSHQHRVSRESPRRSPVRRIRECGGVDQRAGLCGV